jgi:hypothetical protein
MTNYTWVVSAGGTITSGGGTGNNTVTVTWTTTGTQTVFVNYTNSNGCTASAPTVYSVTVNSLPVPVISGPASACVNSTGNVYSTTAGMTNYAWVVSAGGTITSGGGSSNSTVTVTWTTTGAKTVSVNYTNSNGCTASVPTVYNVTVNALPVPVISGPASPCVNSTGNVYSTSAGMTNYTWVVSAGGTITAGGGTGNNTVTVTWNTASGQTVSVNYTSSNGCTASAPTVYNVTVNTLPVPVISGPASACVNSTGNVYSTTVGMTNYTWLVSAGGTITSGGGSSNSSVTVTWNTASGQTLSVNYTNSNGCTAATPTVYNITVNDLPTIAPIAGGALTVSVGASTPAFTDATAGGTWSIVPGTGAASIGTDGIVTGLAAGTVTVNYTVFSTCGSASATWLLTVNAVFSVSFVPGWNWFSVNTQMSDMSLGSVLPSVNTNGDYIKNQTSSATYYTGYGWFGTLSVIDPTKLYLIKVQNNINITFPGTPVNCNSTSIGLVTGWNWIGYLPQSVLSLSDALSSLSLSNLDYIKNQTKSSTYYTSFGWFGSLTNLSPAEGYMIKLATPGTLKYPDALAKKGEGIFVETDDLSLNSAGYEYNGSITASVYVDGVLAGSEYDRIFAYVKDEIRGESAGHYFEPTGMYLYPVMIHSNLSDGELITFKYYDAENDKLYPCNDTITFTKDMIVADAFNPHALNVNKNIPAVVKKDEPDELQLKTYPNPFEHFLNIEYYISKQINISLTIYDSYGRIIKVLVDDVQKPDHYSIQWEPYLQSGGMYIIKLQIGTRQIIRKVMLTRKNT